MNTPPLIIGGAEFPLEVFPISQTYSQISGSSLLRMMDGTGLPQTSWRKLSTSISGSGWAPAALAGIAWPTTVEISCIEPRSIHSASNVATIPAARRSDWAVVCRAVVAGRLVETPVVVVTNTATATAVSGATSYQFHYMPKATFYSKGPTEPLDMQTGTYSWQLDAEEV
jgi:hypothetical protein